jgi:hypothetical protein
VLPDYGCRATDGANLHFWLSLRQWTTRLVTMLVIPNASESRKSQHMPLAWRKTSYLWWNCAFHVEATPGEAALRVSLPKLETASLRNSGDGLLTLLLSCLGLLRLGTQAARVGEAAREASGASEGARSMASSHESPADCAQASAG